MNMFMNPKMNSDELLTFDAFLFFRKYTGKEGGNLALQAWSLWVVYQE